MNMDDWTEEQQRAYQDTLRIFAQRGEQLRKENEMADLFEVTCTWCSVQIAVFDVDNEKEATPKLRKLGWRHDPGGAWICPSCTEEIRKLEWERGQVW